MNEEIDNKLSKLKESCLFYLKLDFGFLAAIATITTILGLNREELILNLAEFHFPLKTLITLIIYAFIYDAVILQIRTNPKLFNIANINNKRLFQFLTSASIIQTIGHILLILGLFAYISGYLRAVSDFHANIT